MKTNQPLTYKINKIAKYTNIYRTEIRKTAGAAEFTARQLGGGLWGNVLPAAATDVIPATGIAGAAVPAVAAPAAAAAAPAAGILGTTTTIGTVGAVAGIGAAAIGAALLVTGIANLIVQSSDSFAEVKGTLRKMLEEVDKQEKDGFGPYQKTFVEFKNAVQTVMQDIDDVVKPPQNQNDPTQVKAAQEFVRTGSIVLSKMKTCLEAFGHLGDLGSSFGNALSCVSFGFQITRYNVFHTYMYNIEKPLTELVNKTQENLAELAKTQAKANAKTASRRR